MSIQENIENDFGNVAGRCGEPHSSFSIQQPGARCCCNSTSRCPLAGAASLHVVWQSQRGPHFECFEMSCCEAIPAELRSGNILNHSNIIYSIVLYCIVNSRLLMHVVAWKLRMSRRDFQRLVSMPVVRPCP